jgi:hypothetical protein
MEEVLAERRAEEDRLLAARGAIVDGVQMCVCGLKLPKDVSKHLTTALHERKCRALGIWRDPLPRPAPSTPLNRNAPLVSPVSLSQQQNIHASRLHDAEPRAIEFEEEELNDDD